MIWMQLTASPGAASLLWLATSCCPFRFLEKIFCWAWGLARQPNGAPRWIDSFIEVYRTDGGSFYAVLSMRILMRGVVLLVHYCGPAFPGGTAQAADHVARVVAHAVATYADLAPFLDH